MDLIVRPIMDRRPHYAPHELHANELILLPYYITGVPLAGSMAPRPDAARATCPACTRSIGAPAFRPTRWTLNCGWIVAHIACHDTPRSASLLLRCTVGFHGRRGLHQGLTVAEIEEVMTHQCLYIGFPGLSTPMRAARVAFDR